MARLAGQASQAVLRRDVVAVGRRLYERGLVVAAEGNVSARLANGNILITPAGLCKGRMKTSDLVAVDRAGKKLTGRLKPSTEMGMHLTALRARPDVNACVHAHPPFATAFAAVGVALDQCVLPEIITTLGSIPLADYATPSTPEVGASIEPYLATYDAFLLRNHGVLTLGPDLETAFRRMETVERYAQILHLAKAIGPVTTLSSQQVDALLSLAPELRRRFAKSGVPVCGDCMAKDDR
jgi:L-fuculose-phosphate aldolase